LQPLKEQEFIDNKWESKRVFKFAKKGQPEWFTGNIEIEYNS